MKNISIYNYKDYEIFVGEAPSYSYNSADNKPYEKIIFIDDSEFKKCIEIEVNLSGEIHNVLIIASYLTPTRSFVELHHDGLFLMLHDTLCIFDPKNLEIRRKIKIRPMGTMFEVYPYGEDYILYGECEIYRISSDLTIKWEFSGRDIFVRHQGNEPAFEMGEDKICLYDFEDNYYEISYDGRVLLDNPINLNL